MLILILICSSIFQPIYSVPDPASTAPSVDNSDYSEAMRLLKQVEKIKHSKTKPKDTIKIEGLNRNASDYMQIPLSASFIVFKYPLTILVCTVLTYILLSRYLPKTFS